MESSWDRSRGVSRELRTKRNKGGRPLFAFFAPSDELHDLPGSSTRGFLPPFDVARLLEATHRGGDGQRRDVPAQGGADLRPGQLSPSFFEGGYDPTAYRRLGAPSVDGADRRDVVVGDGTGRPQVVDRDLTGLIEERVDEREAEDRAAPLPVLA